MLTCQRKPCSSSVDLSLQEGGQWIVEENIADRLVYIGRRHAVAQEENRRGGEAEVEIDGAVVEDTERERDTENENHNDRDATGCAVQLRDQND